MKCCLMHKPIQKKTEIIEQFLDLLSLGSVLQYCVYRFLQSTMFVIYYSQTYKLITMGLLLVFGGIRYINLIIKKWGRFDKQERIRFLFRSIGAWILAMPFFYVGWLHDYKALIFLPICCMCLYDMDANKVCRSFVIVISILLISTVFCCLAGTVRNLTGREISAYGIINSTDFAAYGTFLLLTLWCAIRHRQWSVQTIYGIFVIVVSYILYILTGSRTANYSAALIILFIAWEMLYTYLIQNNKRIETLKTGMTVLSTMAFPMFGILAFVLALLFRQQNACAVQINQLLNGRISVIVSSYDRYGISAFGSAIKNGHGMGGTAIPSWTDGYGYIDVAYAMLAIKYGLVITGIVTGFWAWFTAREIKKGNICFALAMVLLAAHGFSEARILDVNYNIFLIMFFCKFESPVVKIAKRPVAVEWMPILSGAVIIGGVFIVLPRFLSWLRTFFYLKAWNHGTSSMKSLLFTVYLVVLVWIVWKTFIILWQRRKKKGFVLTVALLFSLVMMITISMVMVNNDINRGVDRSKERIKAEAPLIQKIKEIATLPIYAAESSELYKRSIGVISDHIFSSEQLYYKPRGTLLATPMAEAGGKYLQISDLTSIHTYDKAVIDGLLAEGYEWSEFNNSKHYIDLFDTALFNGLKPDQPLVLKSREKIRTENCQIDQFAGTYELSVSLSILEKPADGKVCFIDVFGEAGDKVVISSAIDISDFDKYGECEFKMIYQIADTPRVMYGIRVDENAVIQVKEIAWQRIL